MPSHCHFSPRGQHPNAYLNHFHSLKEAVQAVVDVPEAPVSEVHFPPRDFDVAVA